MISELVVIDALRHIEFSEEDYSEDQIRDMNTGVHQCIKVVESLVTERIRFFNEDALNVKPVLDRILIKQDEGREEVAGFEVPESEKEKPHTGTVVAVGPGMRDHEGRLVPMTAKVGDKVVYSEYATTSLEIDGQDYILIKEGDLHLIL